MRENHRLADPAPATDPMPVHDSQPLDLFEIFARVAPLEVDLGCGDGAYLAQLAAAFPDRNFLGVERLYGRARSAINKIAQSGLSNARILRADTSLLVTQLSPASVAVFHLMFPDPWPKRRHQNRRLVNEQFLESIHRVLAPGGNLQIATDQADYFKAICANAGRQGDLFEEVADHQCSFATSTFEQRYRDLGLPIYRLVLRKISEPR